MPLPNFAFIDSQNLHQSVRHQGWSLDWRKFRVYLKDKYNIAKAFTCIGYVPGNERLYKMLQQSGFTTVFKPTLHVHSSGRSFIKGNVDAELVLQTMIEWNNFHRALIVTGDGDFHCLIRYLKTQEKLLGILIPDSKSYSSLLRNFHDDLNFIDPLRHKLQYTKRRGSNLRTEP